MNCDEYARMHALEDWYWWFVARRDAAARFLRDHAPPERPLRILDAGCGTGGMLDLFRTWPDAEAVGVDLSPEALRFSRGRGHSRLVGGDLNCLPFRSDSFDVVTALDVIEHVADDDRAVAELTRVLRPGGILVASVPAYGLLWGPHDVALHHRRRYGGGEFEALLRRAALVVEKRTHLVTALFPLAAVSRLVTRHRAPGPGGHRLPTVPRPINRLLIGLHAAETAVARHASLPFGLGILAVARKPVPVTVAGALLTPPAEEAVPQPA